QLYAIVDPSHLIRIFGDHRHSLVPLVVCDGSKVREIALAGRRWPDLSQARPEPRRVRRILTRVDETALMSVDIARVFRLDDPSHVFPFELQESILFQRRLRGQESELWSD